MELTRTQLFIKKCAKRLTNGCDFFNRDTQLMKASRFNTSKIKVLIIFPSSSDVKSVSATKEVINDYFLTECPDYFVDFAYLPNKDEIKIYDEYSVPYAIGNITHLDASFFDFVGFSISVLCEVLATPLIIKSFQRCNKPIPLTWSERKDEKIGTYPIMFAGGITCSVGDIMFGTLLDGRQSFLDFLYLGDVEKLKPSVFDKYLGYKGSIQGYIESLFDERHIYQPQAYEVQFEDCNVVLNKKINPKAQDWVQPYYPYEESDRLLVARGIPNGNGDATGKAQVELSQGCGGSSCCFFCHEGWYEGGHREVKLKTVVKNALEAKKYTAADTIRPYSFNTNHYTDYTELLYELQKIYPKVTFINQRMDELGRDPDSLKMMKLVGANRMSAPFEGISPRIRNGILNKNLSELAVENFMKYLISLKMQDIKVGIVWSGTETDEDFQWAYDFVKRWKQYAKENGRTAMIRFKATPLVQYAGTPLYYAERIVARRSYNNERNMSDYWYTKYKEIDLGVKTNGFRYSTFIEQSIVDLGRLITPWLYRQVLMRDQMVWSLRQVADDESVRDLKSYITPGFFKAKPVDNSISINHRIRIQLQGSLLFAARRLEKGDFDASERCLKTYQGAITKCRKNALKDLPYKAYADVWFEDGKLKGDEEHVDMITGCSYCQTPEMQKWRLNRDVRRKYTSDDLYKMQQLTPVQRLRFSVLRKPAFSLLSPNNTSHTSIAKLLDLSEVLLKSFHSVNLHNHFWQSEPFLPYDVAGRQMIDVLFTEKLDLDYIRTIIDQANQVLETVQIQSVSEPTREDKLSPEDLNIYTFKADLPNEEFTFARVGYKGEVRFMRDDFGTATYEVLTDKDLEAPVTVYKDGTVKGAFILKAKYNPYLFIQSVLKDKKHNLNELRERISFTCIGTARLSQRVCKCGRDRILYSLNTDSELGLCSHCLPSLLLK